MVLFPPGSTSDTPARYTACIMEAPRDITVQIDDTKVWNDDMRLRYYDMNIRVIWHVNMRGLHYGMNIL
jgi:hypothetical protein